MPEVNFLSLITLSCAKGINLSGEYVLWSSLPWTVGLRSLSLLEHLLSFAPTLAALLIGRTIFKHYQRGEVFSSITTGLYKALALVYMVQGLFLETLSDTLLTWIATGHRAPGQRILSIGFGLEHIKALGFGAMIWILATIMAQAHHLYEEEKHTI